MPACELPVPAEEIPIDAAEGEARFEWEPIVVVCNKVDGLMEVKDMLGACSDKLDPRSGEAVVDCV
jgi:hypothetical protein